MDPRVVLPQEAWETIFDEMEEPQDWENLYKSSPYFKEIMEEKRTAALFARVLPQVLKHLIDKEDVSGALHLRLVSRQVKKVVDIELKSLCQEEGSSSSSSWKLQV